MSKEERLEYLEEERKKLWAKMLELEELVAKKTSDYEESAKLSSEQAAVFKTSSEEATKTIAEHLADANAKATELAETYRTANERAQKVEDQAKSAFTGESAIKDILTSLSSKSVTANENLQKIETIFTNLPTYETNAKKLEEFFTKGNESDSKINALYDVITTKKKEIDDLYFKVFGITETEKETGKEVHSPGLVDQLEGSYAGLKNNLEQSAKELDDLKISTEKDYRNFTEAKDQQIKKQVESWEVDYSTMKKEINDLLPHALTTGLSYAYAAKREAEEQDRINHQRNFRFGIWGLIGVSMIPFAFSVAMLFSNVPLEEVILKLPRFVLAILPIYIPFLWVAYSANKKLNLSKRLIEEYSHKETLSKTFEGLATQIKNIQNKDVSEDLRIRLLYNILEVNSENPGKLISDYNKSDHPFMDTLDKSSQLTDSFNKLLKIPGMKKLAEKVAKQADNILAEQSKKVEIALDSMATTNSANGNGKEPEA